MAASRRCEGVERQDRVANMQPRLKADIWVAAHIRRCRSAGVDAYLVRRGDSDAGGIVIKLNKFEQGCLVYTPTTSIDGGRAWSVGTGKQLVPEADADAYIDRQKGYDPDIWVLEIEDRSGTYDLGETII
jgi:hypothetical protein